jgi:UDP-glucose:(heptosyl)LPS alpha-1,3-glucosyltransferase
MPGLDVYYAGDSCYIEKAYSQRSAAYRLLPRFKSFVAAERAVFEATSNTEILTISNVEVPLYRQHYRTPAERFHPLPPGIEKDRVAPDNVADIRREFRAEFNLRDDRLVILFVGSGFIKKGLDRALLAVAALPPELRKRVAMFVIGRDKSDAFERMSMRLGLASQVTFFAEGRDDVPRFLFSADALLHPAYDETAGMVIIEAMLAGLPALVTRNCGYAKHLSEHDAGIVLPLPFSQVALNEALEELLTSPLRQQWRANGLAAKHQTSLFELVPKAIDHLEHFARGSRPLLVFVLFRYFAYGGLQRDLMRIANEAFARGYDILIYCTAWEGELPENFQVVIIDAPGVSNHSRYLSFSQRMHDDARWRQPAAIIGFNRMPGLDVYYAADSCFEHKAQQLRTPMYRRTERYRVMSEFERAVFGPESKTDIMLIAQSQREQFQHYYHTADERLTMLPPGVSKDRARGDDWQLQRETVRQEFGIGQHQNLLLLVGSGFVTKGLDRALLVLASLPAALRSSTHLLVIGEDNPRQFLRQARTLGVEESLTIVKGRDDIPAVLQAADLMVHPAYMESGGMVLVEAVIAGLPVIASGVCGFAHFISDADAGVVLDEPFEQEVLNQTVARVLLDPEQRATWSANGVGYGQQNERLYNMPDHAMQVIEASVEKVRERNKVAFEKHLSTLQSN